MISVAQVAQVATGACACDCLHHALQKSSRLRAGRPSGREKVSSQLKRPLLGERDLRHKSGAAFQRCSCGGGCACQRFGPSRGSRSPSGQHGTRPTTTIAEEISVVQDVLGKDSCCGPENRRYQTSQVTFAFAPRDCLQLVAAQHPGILADDRRHVPSHERELAPGSGGDRDPLDGGAGPRCLGGWSGQQMGSIRIPGGGVSESSRVRRATQLEGTGVLHLETICGEAADHGLDLVCARVVLAGVCMRQVPEFSP